MSNGAGDDKIYKALGSSIRREILDRLKDRPATTGMLCEQFAALDRCTVMQHLKVLEDAGLVISKRRGRERWNFLDAVPIKRIHDRWIGSYAAYAVDMLDRLEAEVGE